MIAMEPPSTNDADAIRDEKLKVLKSLKPFTAPSVARDVVRGQYRAGAIGGQQVPGYLEEQKVPAGSTTETFVALRTEVQNWRWAGVPFYLRTGKRMAQRLAEIVVNFRAVPHSIFPGVGGAAPQGNRLVIRLQPDEELKLFMMAKVPGDSLKLKPVELNLDFAEQFGQRPMEAYERLLLDAIRGNLRLFMRRDELDAAWRWCEPILDAWQASDQPPRPYAAGSWGPPAASALVGRDGVVWQEET
jgi:glucose-6-phosphate 1-dehydrogenase